MSHWQRNPGRTRKRLCALLLRHGIVVEPGDLWTQEGGYRSPQWDLARWGTYRARFVDGKAPDGTEWTHDVILSSWSKMTECLKWGISVGKEDEFGLWNHVSVEHARQPGEE
jgi:hypothetical protein